MPAADWAFGTGIVAGAGAIAAAAVAGRKVWSAVQARGLDRWVPSALFPTEPAAKLNFADGPVDVFIAICDHFEPQWGRTTGAPAVERVDHWVREYPRLFGGFADVNGRAPQHTFFFPQDEYQPVYLDRLSPLIREGFGDVDIHLHHDHDTADGLRDKLCSFRDTLFERHGLLRRDPRTGHVVYGFIHGNWALCNSRRDGRWCGVDHELPVLLETGCYADFTFPSAPSDTQPPLINQIYYAQDTAVGRRAHESGIRARVGQAPSPNSLLMIQGPLGFDHGRRKWGLFPKIENGDLLASHPPSGSRIANWLNAGVTVAGQPRWRFVKLHTHGCKPENLQMWLSPVVQEFHRELAEMHADEPRFRYHYVTAWEMAQLVHQAENGQPPQRLRLGGLSDATHARPALTA